MPTIIARKNFIRRVSITGAAAISLADLMRSAAAVTNTPAWGTHADGSKSADSFIADYATVIPAGSELFVGYDAQVKDVDAAGTYKGVPFQQSEPFNTSHYFRGPVDANGIFFYSALTQDLDVVFQGL